jgi:prophage antirepressor-like protein
MNTNANANVSLFNFNGHDVRVVDIDGAPWWVAVDVCRTLNAYLKSNGEVQTNNALRPLDRAEVTHKPIMGKRGPRSTALISESGLYKLVMRSDKPEARQFQDWVTREVLPSIHKYGGYVLGQEEMTADQLLRAVAKFAGKRWRRI